MSIQNCAQSRNVLRSQDAEEFANSLTHAFGLVLSLIGTLVLMEESWNRVSNWLFVACGIYAATLVALYLASTLSHVWHRSSKRRLLRMLDQGCIFLLIAGSFTPFAVAILTGRGGELLLAVMWTTALAGFFSKVIWAHRVEHVSLWIYLALGWMPLIAIRPILDNIPPEGFLWILAGGLCYSAGVIFLTLDEKVPYFHAVWHLFVIAGSVCHYVALLRFIIQRSAA